MVNAIKRIINCFILQLFGYERKIEISIVAATFVNKGQKIKAGFCEFDCAHIVSPVPGMIAGSFQRSGIASGFFVIDEQLKITGFVRIEDPYLISSCLLNVYCVIA
jgi:hypothetical protein